MLINLWLKAKSVALPVSWATWLCNQGRSELCCWVSYFGSRAQQALSGGPSAWPKAKNIIPLTTRRVHGKSSPSEGSLLQRGVLRNPHASGWISRGLRVRWLSAFCSCYARFGPNKKRKSQGLRSSGSRSSSRKRLRNNATQARHVIAESCQLT